MNETVASQADAYGDLDEGSSDTEKRDLPVNADGTENTITKTMTAQDWTGPNDPDNPHNWPFWKKVYNTMAPSFFAFTV